MKPVVNPSSDGNEQVAPAEGIQGALASDAPANDVVARAPVVSSPPAGVAHDAIGRMARRIAHELNNSLTVISGYARLLQQQFADQPSITADVDQILVATEEAVVMMAQLQAFGRSHTPSPQLVDLCEFVSGAELALRELSGPSVAISISCEGQALILVDPAQLRQAVFNLASNARDAMPGGGWLRLEVTREGGFCTLTVSDNGHGMTAETLANAATPFFTTKTRVLGLGLSIVSNVMRAAGGTIELSSDIERGTSVTLNFRAAHG